MSTVLLIAVVWILAALVVATLLCAIICDGRRRYQRAVAPLQPLDLSRARRRQVARRHHGRA